MAQDMTGRDRVGQKRKGQDRRGLDSMDTIPMPDREATIELQRKR